MEKSNHLFAEDSHISNLSAWFLFSHFQKLASLEGGKQYARIFKFLVRLLTKSLRKSLNCCGMRRFLSWISDCLAARQQTGQVSQHHTSPAGIFAEISAVERR